MSNLNRDFCVFSGNRDLEMLYSFEKFPVFMGCVDTPPADDIFKSMNWYISRSSGSLQMNPLVPLELVYLGQHNDSTGGIWDAHHTAFAEFLHGLNPRKVFEIGGATGALYGKVSDLQPVEWTILDPNPEVVTDSSISAIKGFFGPDFREEVDFDILVHSHVFEHVYNPMEFVQALSGYVPEDKLIAFSVPNMRYLLENCFTNALNFEHTYFLIPEYIEYLLSRNGFEILSSEPFRTHSRFYLARRTNAVSSIPLPDLYEEHRAMFMKFINLHLDVVAGLNDFIKRSDVPVYLFGAHIFSQFLLAFGLQAEGIETVLDNSPVKISRRLYGTDFIVQSPEVLRDVSSAAVILRAGHYNEEIKKNILENINANINFLE